MSRNKVQEFKENTQLKHKQNKAQNLFFGGNLTILMKM